MNELIKIALLHLILLGAQAFYMYFSNKKLFLKNKYLYLAAIPYVAAFPCLLNESAPSAYHIYEYSVVILIIAASVVDVVIAARKHRDYLTAESACAMHYAYFAICAASSVLGKANFIYTLIPALLLVASFCFLTFVKKHESVSILKAIPFALISMACSWAFVRFILKI